ncbi:unnamed protein product [Tenebrio molitor]|nr:unnamed protein product [Tenebrio molitor]
MLGFGVGDVVGVALLLTVISSVSSSPSTYLCPRKFVPIGKKCYHFSNDLATWHDAHFSCSSLNSSLAIITRPQQELAVRRYLNRGSDGKHERWLGGRYNEKTGKWVWGENGKPLVFHGFSRMNANDRRWEWHCIVVDPAVQNKWSAKGCFEKERYVCQRSAIGRRKSSGSKCNGSVNDTSRGRCKVGSSAPGFLVKRQPKKYKSYHPATFVCPPHMILVGRKCYFFSIDKTSWSNAYWACRDNKTKLAVITTRIQDNILRGFLEASFAAEKHERWIGGIYDWKQKKWKWAMSGRSIKYKNFANPDWVAGQNNTHHCITLDPELKHLWNSKNRLEDKHYICQAKSRSVVKYDKPLKPKATVVIKVAEDDSKGKFKKTVTTTASPSHYNNEVTDKYIYN